MSRNRLVPPRSLPYLIAKPNARLVPSFVVTGASQGIGEATALLFSNESEARISLVSRNRERLDAVARRCNDVGAQVLVAPCDATVDDAVADMAGMVLEAHGPPDVVVNNAGLFTPGSILDTDADSFRSQIDSNLISAFLVTRAFLPHMLDRGRGHLFFMGSVASTKGYPGGIAYCAAKHGVLGLARAVREETRETGIRVTTLLPGATWTPSWEGTDLTEERFMPAGDIARTILDIYRLNQRTVVEEILIRPMLGDV